MILRTLSRLSLALAATVIMSVLWPSVSVARTLNRAVASAQLLPTGLTTVTARCPGVTRRVSGGFLANHAGGTGLLVRASYPSRNGWTVEVENVAPVAGDITVVSAIVYCTGLRAGETFEIRENSVDVPYGGGATGPSFTTVRASCGRRRGVVAVGGGFRIDGGLTAEDLASNGGLRASEPEPWAWRLTAGNRFAGPGAHRNFTAFVVCASGVQRGTLVVADSQEVARDPESTVSAACPDAGTSVAAGGFTLAGANDELSALPERVYASYAAGSSWDVTVGTVPQITNKPRVAALCVPMP